MMVSMMVYGNVIIIIWLYDKWSSGVMVEVSKNRKVVWLFGVVILGKLVFVLIVIVSILYWLCVIWLVCRVVVILVI